MQNIARSGPPRVIVLKARQLCRESANFPVKCVLQQVSWTLLDAIVTCNSSLLLDSLGYFIHILNANLIKRCRDGTFQLLVPLYGMIDVLSSKKSFEKTK